MKRMKIKSIAILVIWMGGIASLLAQTDSVQTQHVTVTRTYEPTVRDAGKIDRNPPATVDVPVRKTPIEYRLPDVEAVSTFETGPGKLVRPVVRLEQFDERPGYGEWAVGYPLWIKGGGGYVHESYSGWKWAGEGRFDYRAPYRNKSYAFGHDLNMQLGGVALKDYTSGIKTRYRLDYTLNGAVWRDTLDPAFNTGEAFAWHGLHPHADIRTGRNYLEQAALDYYLTAGRELGEHIVSLKGQSVVPLEGFRILTGWELNERYGRYDGGSYSNFYAGLLPSLRLEKEKLLFNLGFKLYYQNRADVNDRWLFYPDVSVDFRMIDEYLTVYARYTGGLQNKGYREWTGELPWIAPVADVRPVSNAYRLAGGFKGALSSQMAYVIELGAGRFNNYPFLVYSPWGDRVAFSWLYDSMDDYYFNVLLAYVIPEQFETKVRFHYAQYSPRTLKRAYNMPDYSVDWLLRFKLKKFTWESTLRYIGPRFDLVDGREVKLDDFADVNLKWNYEILPRLNLYLQGENLAARSYMMYWNTPRRPLQVAVGAFYSF